MKMSGTDKAEIHSKNCRSSAQNKHKINDPLESH